MNRTASRLIPLLVVVWALAGCATVATPPSTAPTPAPATGQPTPATTVPAPAAAPGPATEPAAGKLSLATHWFRDSAEYRGVMIQTYRAAAAELERLAGVLTPGGWAVSLDGDETVLDNSLYQKELEESGRDFSPASWAAWVKRRESGPLPGAVGFLTRVQALGGKVAIVTNRAHDLCADTEETFRRFGIPYDLILCKPESGERSKQPRWDAVEAGTAAPGVPPLEIVMYVGDNIFDFPRLDQGLRHAPESAYADFGSLYFQLPNPMYGSWESNPAE